MALLPYDTEPGKTGTNKYLKLFHNRTLFEVITQCPKYQLRVFGYYYANNFTNLAF